MKIFFGLSIITLYLFSSCVIGDKCPEGSWRHKQLRLGIFYTRKYYQSWKHTMTKEGTVELSVAIRGIARRLTKYFSKKHFQTASITFEVADKDVLLIENQDLDMFNAHKLFRMHTTANLFCKFAQKKKAELKQTWDYAFLLTDAELQPAYTAGSVAKIHAMCSTQSCAVVNFKSTVFGSSTEFMTYPKLLAYFLGLSLGLSQGRYMTIKKQPGTNDVHWTKHSRQLLASYFNDSLEFRCLRWSCGAYDNSKELFSRPKLVDKLNQLCGSIFPNLPAKLDTPKTNAEFNLLTRGRLRSREYVSFLAENRYWYRLENLCKGVPCVLVEKNRRAAFTLYEDDMEGEFCGENKECKKGACVSVSNEGKEEEHLNEETTITYEPLSEAASRTTENAGTVAT